MSNPTLSNQLSLPLVAPLAHFGRADLSLAGGKGANLGELVQAGFDVPPGFIITTAAYDLMLPDNAWQTQEHGHPEDLELMLRSAKKIRENLDQIPIPAMLVQEITGAYRKLGSLPVAVRSSATAEDLPGAAFAGQQETFLNIQGEAALLAAVKACWASLWSERAVVYRARQKINPQTVKLAVVVQKMVPADAAGVMFSANPISGARDEIVIDASPGLGEAVVAGLVTPDHFILEKRDGRVKEQHLGKRELFIRQKAGGGTEQIVPAEDGTVGAALPAAAMRRLAKLGAAIERHYTTPQDIEWAWINDGTKTGEFLILQARPMTALPEPLKIKVKGPMSMVLPMLAEMWPVRPYPLDMSTFTGAVERAVGNFLVVMLGKSAPDPDQALVEADGVVVCFQPPEVRPSAGMLVTAGRTFWRTRHNDPSKWALDPRLAEALREGQKQNELDPATLSWSENITVIHQSLALIPRVMQLREVYFPQAILGLGSLWLLVTLARRKACLGVLLGGVETKTTETNRALQDLAAQIHADRGLSNLFSHRQAEEILPGLAGFEGGQAFLKSFEQFMAEYGHRETALTISAGAWQDQPQIVLEILKAQSTADPREPDSYQAWKRVRDELLNDSILGSWPVRGLFLKALKNGRALFQIREDTHFYATLAQPPIRRVALELGARLKAANLLDTSEAVFHLRLDELEGLGQPWPPSDQTRARIRNLVAQRQAKRESLSGKPMIDPRLLAITTRAYPGEDVLLSGSSGSPGVASGPARIVRDSSEFGKLQPGDVLVAPVTNPAWTPLFLHAAAVVVDTGSAASHAAIVAREYGVPAVMGTLNGTKQLKDGQWIRVDGSRGLVLTTKEQG